MQEKIIKIENNTFKRFSVEQLNKLSTQRLLSLLKRNRSYYHGLSYGGLSTWDIYEVTSDKDFKINVEFFNKYMKDIKNILDTREHIGKK